MMSQYYDESGKPHKSSTIPEKKTLTDPEVATSLFHEKKQEILYLLREKEMNIMELKQETNLNPGTIKRYLDDLVSKDLAFLSRKVKNEYGFFLKYYRATAKRFIVHVEWP